MKTDLVDTLPLAVPLRYPSDWRAVIDDFRPSLEVTEVLRGQGIDWWRGLWRERRRSPSP